MEQYFCLNSFFAIPNEKNVEKSTRHQKIPCYDKEKASGGGKTDEKLQESKTWEHHGNIFRSFSDFADCITCHV